MRRPLLVGTCTFLAAAFAFGESAAHRYVLELSDGRRVSASDAPVVRGSVLTFRSPSGTLTGVPREMVVRVRGDEVRAADVLPAAGEREGTGLELEAAAPPLEPGELVILGPLAQPAPAALPADANTAARGGGPAVSGGSFGVGSPYANGVGGATVIDSNLNGIGPDGLPRVLSSTDLSRALAAPGTSPVAPNGFPATPSAPTVIGPDGTPTLAPSASETSMTVIGPNGTPAFASSATPVVGPNGTPVLAPAGQPGSAAPVIGPNGTPNLVPAGQPGSAAPVIGPNGTPVLAAPGRPGSGAASPSTAPNGTPASGGKP